MENTKGSKTSSDWYNFCRDVCRETLPLPGHEQEMIGGPGKVVEIDESAFSKRKYNRGSRRQTHWVFGGVERDSNKCFIVSVRKRNRRTLWPLIFKHIRPGTNIISDGWKAYIGLDKHGYIHETVNHILHFKDPETGAHTNKIEGSWLHIKRTLAPAGNRKSLLKNHFAVYIWRKRFGGRIDSFREFLEHAGVVYNPNVEPTFQYAHTQHLPLFDPDQASQSTATNTEADADIEQTTARSPW